MKLRFYKKGLYELEINNNISFKGDCIYLHVDDIVKYVHIKHVNGIRIETVFDPKEAALKWPSKHEKIVCIPTFFFYVEQ